MDGVRMYLVRYPVLTVCTVGTRQPCFQPHSYSIYQSKRCGVPVKVSHIDMPATQKIRILQNAKQRMVVPLQDVCTVQ
jgi:hypothetical protein